MNDSIYIYIYSFGVECWMISPKKRDKLDNEPIKSSQRMNLLSPARGASLLYSTLLGRSSSTTTRRPCRV